MRATLLGLLLSGTAVAAVPATAVLRPSVPQAQDSTLQRAFWLEEHEGSLAQAKAMYEAIARDPSNDADTRAEARRRATALAQDLIADDLAQVLPPDTVVYAQLSHPGEHLAGLLEALGIYGKTTETGAFGVSPELVRGLFDLKAAALAITGLPVGGGVPSGVLVVHPGDLEVVRGLLETALPADGQAADPIEGYSTWRVSPQGRRGGGGISAYVTLTERLLIASTDPDQIGSVIERMRGDDPDSLAGNEDLKRALAQREDALVTVCVNAQPLQPLLRQLTAQAARQDPQAAIGLSLLDVPSMKSLAAHLTVGREGLALDVGLELAEGHRNIVFDLLRRPNVVKDTFALVPEGAAFALATAMNPEQAVAPLPTDVNGRPIVSLLDLGREVFSNVIDVALYGVPSEEGATAGLPDVALVLRTNDTARTRALFDLALGTATRAVSGGTQEPRSDEVAGVATERYEIQGVPLFLAAEDGRVVLTPSRAALARSIDAAAGRGSLLTDPLYAPEMARVDGSGTLLVLANPGRCARMAAPFAPAAERRKLAPLADLLSGTVVSLGVVHDDTRLGARFSVRSLPDVSSLVARALRGEDPLAAPASPAARRTAAVMGAPTSVAAADGE